MMRKSILLFVISAPLFLLFSCAGDSCRKVETEKAEWITRYENYQADTLASYSIVQDYVYFDESMSSQIKDIINSYNNLSNKIDNLYSKSNKYTPASNDYRNAEKKLNNLKNAIDNYFKSTGTKKGILSNINIFKKNKNADNSPVDEHDTWSKDIDAVITDLNKSPNTSSSNNGLSELKNEISILHSSKPTPKNPSGNNNVTRIVEIRNNSDFPTSFALKDNNNFFPQTEYRIVMPHSTTEFRLSRLLSYGDNNKSNFTSNFVVLQNSQKIKLTRPVNELKLSKIMVNTCEQSIEALKKQYQTVKDLYNEKVGK